MNATGRSLIIGVLGLAPLALYANSIPYTGNLLINPGGETGNLAPWTAGGNTGAGIGTIASLGDNITPYDGTYDFMGGANAPKNPLGSLSQTVSIITGSVTTSRVNTGNLTADVSYWEQSKAQGPPSDEGYIQLTFLNGSNGVISTVDMPGVYSNGVWKNYTEQFAIPVGTQSIIYSMEFKLEQGTNIDAFIDDNSLSIYGPAFTTPESPTLVMQILGICALGTGFLFKVREKFA
jgi:hypothetical protein